jgi:hypothetical protein
MELRLDIEQLPYDSIIACHIAAKRLTLDD